MKCRVIGEVFVSYIFLITFVETFLKDFVLNRVVYALEVGCTEYVLVYVYIHNSYR